MKQDIDIQEYTDQIAVQLRRGYLTYCVLMVCRHKPVYSSDIIGKLSAAKLSVAEGTIYPLLMRLQRDGLLIHEWQESEQGPPRKYYRITETGSQALKQLKTQIDQLEKTIKELEKGAK